MSDAERSLPAFDDAKKKVVSEVVDELGGDTCTPEKLMDAARSPDHPMHSGFGFLWDRDQAAYQYNHRVAYNLIRITEMRTKNSRKEPIVTSRYWSVRKASEEGKCTRGFVSAKDGIKSADYALQELVKYQRHLCGTLRNNIDFLATRFPFCAALAEALDAFDREAEKELKKAQVAAREQAEAAG